MTKHFERALARVNKELLTICSLVEESVYRAVKSTEERDASLARQVIAADTEIDRREVELEEECLHILALNQPVAQDLRFIIAALKLNNDLERIGDLSVNIAERALSLSTMKQLKIAPELAIMEDLAKTMVRQSIQALIKQDTKSARSIMEKDADLDAIYARFLNVIEESIRQSPQEVEALLLVLSVARNLERIGDHCTNIAEDVVYLVEGEIVRHLGQPQKDEV